MEDKKIGRLSGSKVSQIANIFQGMAPNKESSAEYIGPIRSSKTMVPENTTFEKEAEPTKDSPTQVTVMRTESHLARFNTARALFEKLGEESKGRPDKFVPLQNTKSAPNISDLKSRSSSAYGEPTYPSERIREILQHTSRSPSPPLKTGSDSENLKTPCNSNSFPVLNPHFSNNGFQKSSVNGVVGQHTSTKVIGDEKTVQEKSNGAVLPPQKIDKMHIVERVEDRTIIYAVPVKKPEKPEKPERKFNSKELIEKQKNWTSHFSKTRSSRYNSDPNKSEVRLGINHRNEKHEDTKTESTGQPAVRSQSFSARLRSPPTSPPPPPIRTDSALKSNLFKRDRPASVIPMTTSPVTKTDSTPVQMLNNVVNETEKKSFNSSSHENIKQSSSSSLSPHSMSKSPSEEPPLKENLSATSESLSSLSSPSSPSRVRTEEEKQEKESNEKTLDSSLSSVLSTSDSIYGKL